MNVQFIDFSEQYQVVKEEIDSGIQAVINKGDFILGQKAGDFEAEFARYCGVKYAIGVNSGTDALYLALSALDVGVGDEVILPTFTFIATALCVSYTGAKPIFVDVEDETYNIDPGKLKEAITERTKAIIPVHLYGQAANMQEINVLAREHDIAVVEDACQSHGAFYQDKRTGSLGDIGCFSFYPTKSLGAFGDAGIIVTDDQVIYEKATMLRDYGRQDRYNHKVKGYNSRLDTIQAVVLSAKLKHLDSWNQMRRDNAAIFGKLLERGDGIVLPTVKKDRTHVYQTFAVRLQNRDEICKKMQAKGIGVLIHYPIPLHLQEAYADAGYKQGDFPVSEKLSNEVLSLPMFPHMKQEQIEYVCQILKGLVNEKMNSSRV